jgi:hypothetical protein
MLRIFIRIAPLILISAFLFTGVAYPEPAVSAALRVPMANSKGSKKDFNVKCSTLLKAIAGPDAYGIHAESVISTEKLLGRNITGKAVFIHGWSCSLDACAARLRGAVSVTALELDSRAIVFSNTLKQYAGYPDIRKGLLEGKKWNPGTPCLTDEKILYQLKRSKTKGYSLDNIEFVEAKNKYIEDNSCDIFAFNHPLNFLDKGDLEIIENALRFTRIGGEIRLVYQQASGSSLNDIFNICGQKAFVLGKSVIVNEIGDDFISLKIKKVGLLQAANVKVPLLLPETKPQEDVFASQVIFDTVCDQKKTIRRENMLLIKLSDVLAEKKEAILNAVKQWSELDYKSRKKSKSMFSLWRASPGYKYFSDWGKEELFVSMLPPYMIFDKEDRLAGMADCALINIGNSSENSYYWPEGICLNQIVVNPELREKRYPRPLTIYPELEKDIFILVLGEAANRGLAFNIGTYSSPEREERFVKLLKHYGVDYKIKNQSYIEIPAVEAREFYGKLRMEGHSSGRGLNFKKRGFTQI